jgi:hypothetical protein
LGCVGEYSYASCALGPFFKTPYSFETILTFKTLHPKSINIHLIFMEDYELDDKNLESSSDSFKLVQSFVVFFSC